MWRGPRDEVAAFSVVVEARDLPLKFLKASHRWRSGGEGNLGETSSVDDTDDISDVAPIHSSYSSRIFRPAQLARRFWVAFSFRFTQRSNKLAFWRQKLRSRGVIKL